MRDMTEQLQLSGVWFVKLFWVQNKLEARDRTKTDIFVPHQTTTQLFVSRTSCLKYQNIISSLKNRIKQKKTIRCYKNLSCVVLSCVMLFCLILLCPILPVLQTKTHPYVTKYNPCGMVYEYTLLGFTKCCHRQSTYICL